MFSVHIASRSKHNSFFSTKTYRDYLLKFPLLLFYHAISISDKDPPVVVDFVQQLYRTFFPSVLQPFNQHILSTGASAHVDR